MCQLIMKKLAIPDRVTQQEYWETLKRDTTNNKFSNLRASMKKNFLIDSKVCILTYTNKSICLVMPILFACFAFAEDKHIGWCQPFDSSGRIFVELRSSQTKSQATSLICNDTEKFLCFIDKYVKQSVVNHNLSKVDEVEWIQDIP